MERSTTCSHCRRQIASTYSSCPWCGAPRPGVVSALLSGAFTGDRLVLCIVIVNVVFYLLSLALSARAGLSMNPLTFLSPDRVSLLLLGATGTVPVWKLGRAWSLLAANYLHGGILHIFFNLMALRQIGPWVAQEYGPARMFVIYTLGGIGGFVVSLAAGIPFTIGASAAVCALIGALLYFGKSSGGSYGTAVYREVSGWVISLFIFGFVVPGINNWGHGGGIVSGIVLAMLLGYQERRRENFLHRLLAFFCGVATLVVLGFAVLSAFSYWRLSGGVLPH